MVMSKSRFTHDQIMAVILEMKAERKTKLVARKYNVSTTTLYRWRSKFAEENPSGDRLRSLETENRQLKSKFAELKLDYYSLRAALIKEGRGEC